MKEKIPTWISLALSILVLLITLIRWESRRDTEMEYFKLSFAELKADHKAFMEEVRNDLKDKERRIFVLEHEAKGNPR